METAVKAILGAVSVVLIALMLAAPADAGRRNHKFKVWLQNDNYVELAQNYDNSGEQFPVSEADAADIAQSQFPGAKVLKVRLLPSGVYAVTLKEGGNVSKVRVDARTGAIR
jgi:uncharacterized membrane protein YkoI